MIRMLWRRHVITEVFVSNKANTHLVGLTTRRHKSRKEMTNTPTHTLPYRPSSRLLSPTANSSHAILIQRVSVNTATHPSKLRRVSSKIPILI
jgi:hypothetical protein